MSKEISLLKLKNVSKYYYNKGLVATGFTRVNLEFNLGEFVVITGESGSGKSTLLNVLSGLDSYEEGELYINGEETSHYNESDFEHYRRTYIGNIFQSFNLINSYTVYQNVELVLLLNGFNKHDVHTKIIDLLKKVGLYKFRNTKVSKLSGGQKQRVAIARALAKDTPIIIADEPTGNLDVESSKNIIKLLSDIAKDKLVIIVTHNYEQVEKYATRKIEMHDGKVREDIELKEYNKKDIVLYSYSNIKFTNKIKLGIRNAFNIFSRFILLFLVFLFIICAFLGEYSLFKSLEEEESKLGYNQYFNSSDVTRIVIKKQNNTFLTEDDFNIINNLEDVSHIEKDDILLDSSYNIYNDDFYFWGKFDSVHEIKKVDVGRLPQNEYEVVIKGSRYDYYLNEELDDLFEQDLLLYDDYGANIRLDKKLKVVGVIYHDNDYSDIFYVSDLVLESVRKVTNESYSSLNLNVDQVSYKVGKYDIQLKVVPNKNVPKSFAYYPDSMSYLCNDFVCSNKKLTINISNLYYSESLSLTINKVYSNHNFKTLTGLDKFGDYDGKIFISEADYNSLYNKYTFQSSVFATKISNVDNLNEKLKELGYDTLVIKDTLSYYNAGIMEVINIFRIIVTVVLFVVLFFISYFVIKLIQKSKNVYYSTVRILGGNKNVIRNLITIELFTVYHLAFIIISLCSYLSNNGYLNFGFINSITSKLLVKDFIIIYLILFVMSMILSLTYSRKLFSSSAMKTYRQEV